eukprot:maker-scaffold417_size177606-snap-gene-0.41 protein:Tk07588 transcript:maker-scaffold417_size177606-snap-gene-0.41-mRNA-1 annotation:"hypothetical protein LOTGIDRAFT_218232"
MAPLKSRIQNAFKLHGFQLRLDASRLLEQFLTPLDDTEAQEWVDKVLAALSLKNLDSIVVDRELVATIVQECSNREAGITEENVFHIIDAFDVPRLSYSVERKKYVSDAILGRPEPRLMADADSKSKLFRSRYQLLHQRTIRHSLFAPAAASGVVDTSKKSYKLKTVEFLLGTTAKLNDVIILGMITQVKHGKYSLEDPTGIVSLDLTETKFHTGLYTENSFVLLEGWYEDGTFHVAAMGFPPAETAATSRTYFGSLDFFGSPSDTCVKMNEQLLKIQEEDNDAMFVFLSDVWLDKADVMENLSKLFAGYSAMPPTAFVLMGNYLSIPYGSGQAKALQDNFKALGEMLEEFPDLVEKSKFIFVPGPSDPGFTNIFPRPPIPKCLSQELRNKIPGAEFVTNPCRIQYCAREIVLFREDIVTKMCRNCIYFPESGDIPTHFAKTLVSQGHLAPLPIHICPIYWDYDRSMYLYPLPDLVVVGDKFDPFLAEQFQCQIMNPGSFAKTEFSFKTYVPKTGEIQDSQIPNT